MRWPTQHPLLAGIRPLPTALLLTLLTTPTLAQRAASLPSDLTLPAGLQACTWPPQPNHPYILLSRSPSSSTSLCLASTGSGGVALSSCNGGEAAQRLTFSLVGGTTDQYRIGVESGGQGSCVASGNRFVGTGSPVQVAAHCGDAAVASRWRIGANVEENGISGQLINLDTTPTSCLTLGNVAARKTAISGDYAALAPCAGISATREQYIALLSTDCGGAAPGVTGPAQASISNAPPAVTSTPVASQTTIPTTSVSVSILASTAIASPPTPVKLPPNTNTTTPQYTNTTDPHIPGQPANTRFPPILTPPLTLPCDPLTILPIRDLARMLKVAGACLVAPVGVVGVGFAAVAGWRLLGEGRGMRALRLGKGEA